MIVYKSMSEIEIMDRCNEIVIDILKRLAKQVQPGVSTAELDRFAEEATLEAGAVPAFKGYRGFPASLCTSVNNEVVHGIPSPKRAVASRTNDSTSPSGQRTSMRSTLCKLPSPKCTRGSLLAR